jgi:ATP-dependent Clp protease ATP-binding subunit ClpA
MSEYGEANAGARLIGAPPGYVGHDREGQLTGPLRRQPYAVVLLDEVEKAHPEVFDLFLQLFDAGRLTDASGRTADGRNAIFIMTSNLLTGESARRRLGFGRDTAEQAPDLLAELRRFFRPELLNRVDEIVVFEPLGPAELVEIVGRRAADVRERLLAQHGIALAVSQEALELLARLAGDGQGGAREVNRVVARLLEEPMSRMLLAGEIGPGDQVTAAPDGNRLAIVSAPRAS